MTGMTIRPFGTTRKFYGSYSVGKTRPSMTMSSELESRTLQPLSTEKGSGTKEIINYQNTP
jgi:hypothetical protein